MPDGSLTQGHNTEPRSLGPPDIHLVFAATEQAVRKALGSVRQSLQALSLDEGTLGLIEIVLAEATNNIVEHAYAHPNSGTIAILCSKQGDALSFELSDNGNPLPGGELPSKQHHDLDADLELLPEGGFGWGLIRDITQNLTYQRNAGRNILKFRISSAA